VRRIGVTGHQGLDPRTTEWVTDQFIEAVSDRAPVCGISSLAEGADQIFAEQVLDLGGCLIAVIPCAGYESSFTMSSALARYRELRGRAIEIVELDYDTPEEKAYWAAGKRVVELSEEMFAVWDGKGSGGLGGTADVVVFARQHNVPVRVIWPPGATR
jgi:hypothetical protein